MPSYFTVDQVAQLIDMHPKTIRRYIQEGRLSACKVGKQYRVNQTELDRFMGREPHTKGSNGNSLAMDSPDSIDNFLVEVNSDT